MKQAEGVAQNFIDVYNSYKDAKEVTRRRIYLETLREVLEGKNKIIELVRSHRAITCEKVAMMGPCAVCREGGHCGP